MPRTSPLLATTCLLLASTLASTLAPARAAADTLRATRRQPLREIAHDVRLRLKDGLAHYRVRRTFANTGKLHEQAELAIVLPYGAAVVGLRIRGRERWHVGELLEAERAEKLYRELTGVGPHAPRDPALLRWVWANEAELYVFPIAPGRTSTVEYTLVAPLRYQGGRYHASYPRPGSALALAEPVLRIEPAWAGAAILVDGRLAADGQPVILRRPAPPPGSSSAASAKVNVSPLEQLLRADRSASHVVSRIDVQQTGQVRAIELDIDVRHTYRGDLRVELVTPAGGQHLLHSRSGGRADDVRGHFKVALPRPIAARGSWRLHVSDHARYDVGTLDSWALKLKLATGHDLHLRAKDTPRFIPDAPGGTNTDAGVLSISVEPPTLPLFAARYGRAIAGSGKHFARLEVDVAPVLGQLPKQLSVVFVVDASRSVDESGLRAQLDLALAFLTHVPDAQAELVLYRRHATRLFARFVPAPQVRAELERARRDGALKLGNGSALDAGVQLATTLLRERPAGPRFAVLSGDALLRPRWHADDALQPLAKLPPDAVVHVALPKLDGGPTPRDRRDDAHALAPLAARHNGVLLQITGFPAKAAALAPVALGLVRPVRLDAVHVLDDALGVAKPQTLVEGAGLREFVTLPTSERSIELSAKLWARTIRRRLRADTPFDRATAAFVFSLDRHRGLGRQQMLRLARFGAVVTPVTSYLAIEPGVRPSRVGLERVRGGGFGSGYGSGVGRLRGRRWRYHPRLPPLVAPIVQRCQRRHPASAGWQLSVRVETTYDEIVDVQIATRPGALDRCVVEGIWELTLQRPHFWKQRASYVLHLR